MTVGTSRLSDCYNQRLESILREYSGKSWREKQSVVAQIEREFGWKLYQKALKITSVREDAEDAALHGLVALVDAVEKGTTVDRPWGLLSTAVKNYSLNQAMARSRRDLVQAEDDGTASNSHSHDISGPLEARDLVAFAMKQLSSEEDREILSLRGMYGFEFREIAEILMRKYGRSLSARGVQARYDRARKKLRELLQEELTVRLLTGLGFKEGFTHLEKLIEAMREKAYRQMTHFVDRVARVKGLHSTPIKAYSSARVVRRAIELLELHQGKLPMISHRDHRRSPSN